MSGSRVVTYLDPISPYAFLALERIRGDDAHINIDWKVRPVVYAKLLEAHGLVGPVESEAKRRYTMLDVVRCAERQGLTVVGPPAHPFRSLAALRVLTLFSETEHAFDVALAISRGAWVEGQDLENWSVLSACVLAAGGDATSLEERATSPVNKQLLIDATSEAIESGVFGVPSFRFDTELFWGHDRLDALFERIEGVVPRPTEPTVNQILARPIGVRRRTV